MPAEVTSDLLKIDKIVRKHGVKHGAAIPILQDIQSEFGYVPGFAVERAADLTGIFSSELYSIITFYSQFRQEPIGDNFVQVCHGTACHLAGAEEITNAIRRAFNIKEGNTSPDGKYTVEEVACLGCCSLAPVMNLNGETYGRLNPNKAVEIIKSEEN